MIALLTAVLTVSGAGVVAAKCDPGRAWNVAWRPFGAWMGAQTGVYFYELVATVDNDAIPFVDGGNTHAHIELRNAWERPNQPDGGARIFIALSWSSAQGKLSSTGIRAMIEDEEGDQVLYNNVWRIGDKTSDYTKPRLSIVMGGPSEGPYEWYLANLYGSDLIGGGFGHDHGAEWFNQARVFVATQNDSSQVPGGTNNVQFFGDVQYRSNYGWGTWGSQMLEPGGASWGGTYWGPGYVGTWDKYCAYP